VSRAVREFRMKYFCERRLDRIRGKTTGALGLEYVVVIIWKGDSIASHGSSRSNRVVLSSGFSSARRS
jgi:hypothetical protein